MFATADEAMTYFSNEISVIMTVLPFFINLNTECPDEINDWAGIPKDYPKLPEKDELFAFVNDAIEARKDYLQQIFGFF